jgi:hypothetical protein
MTNLLNFFHIRRGWKPKGNLLKNLYVALCIIIKKKVLMSCENTWREFIYRKKNLGSSNEPVKGPIIKTIF